MKMQNADKLPKEVLNLVAYGFENHLVGWTCCYMYEIKLDDPLTNILEGGDGLKTHGGNGSRYYAKHYGDDEWAIIHYQDEDWLELPHEEMAEAGAKFLQKPHNKSVEPTACSASNHWYNNNKCIHCGHRFEG